MDEMSQRKYTSPHDDAVRMDFIEIFEKRSELKQMNKNECIDMMYDIAEELKG